MMQESRLFDAGRAMLEDYLDGSLYPPRLEVSESQSLAAALDAGIIAPETHLLTFELRGTIYSFPMRVVLCYNVIQGSFDQQPWMMTFCNACNTGMVFDACVNGQTLHFQRRGAYDGLLLLWDRETNSYWQHITGECLHGSSAGTRLHMITNTRHMTAAEALARNPAAHLLTSPLTEEQQMLSGMMEKMRAKPERVESGILTTINAEDTRRPRFELGLGVWDAAGSVFFPLVLLHTHNNVLITEFNGLPLLIYQTADALAPVAAYLPAPVASATWEDDVLRLAGGASIRHDVYYTPEKQAQALKRPNQLLMRWFGFALTFPGTGLPVL